MKRFWDKVNKSNDCWEWTAAKAGGCTQAWLALVYRVTQKQISNIVRNKSWSHLPRRI